MAPIGIMGWSKVLLLMKFMVVKFILCLMVSNKGILLTNGIFPLMLMFLLSFLIYLGALIYYVTTVLVFIYVSFPLNVVILGMYILLDWLTSIIIGKFSIKLDLIRPLKSFWKGIPTLEYIPLDNFAYMKCSWIYLALFLFKKWTRVT